MAPVATHLLPLARPFLGQEEEQAVIDVLRSGQLSLGACVSAFEAEFASRLGARFGSAVSSGTAGLHLALRAAGVSAGDEVITSPFSFVASANAILYEQARPVFVDIDPVTLNIDPVGVDAALTAKTSALLPVHIFGYPADIPALQAHGLPIIEDACEALGAVHADGVPVGARGNLAVFGFYANKQLTTGEGGMVVGEDLAHKQRIDSERNQGRAPDMSWLDHDRLGFNYRLSDIACAIGLAQMAKLDEMLELRAGVAGLYRERLAGYAGQRGIQLPCPDSDGNQRGWFVFVIQLPEGVERASVMAGLKAAGIDSKPYLPAIHLMSFYRESFGFRPGQFPICEQVAERSLALPFFPQMTESDVDRVAIALEHVLESPHV